MAAQTASQMGRSDSFRELCIPPPGRVVAKSAIPYLPLLVPSAEDRIFGALRLCDGLDCTNS